MTTSEPTDCLVEIVQITIDRMNEGKASADESFVLGQIAGVATRVPEVMQRVKEQEQQ